METWDSAGCNTYAHAQTNNGLGETVLEEAVFSRSSIVVSASFPVAGGLLRLTRGANVSRRIVASDNEELYAQAYAYTMAVGSCLATGGKANSGYVAQCRTGSGTTIEGGEHDPTSAPPLGDGR